MDSEVIAKGLLTSHQGVYHPIKFKRSVACAPEFAHICVTKQSGTKSLSTNIGTIPKNMPTNAILSSNG